MIKVDIEMPKKCCECPFYRDENSITGDYGKCQLLEIKDLNGDVVEHQVVDAYYQESNNNIRHEGRSKHCPLKECK